VECTTPRPLYARMGDPFAGICKDTAALSASFHFGCSSAGNTHWSLGNVIWFNGFEDAEPVCSDRIFGYSIFFFR
jgi:hypothetical protein